LQQLSSPVLPQDLCLFNARGKITSLGKLLFVPESILPLLLFCFNAADPTTSTDYRTSGLFTSTDAITLSFSQIRSISLILSCKASMEFNAAGASKSLGRVEE
jgi:hypothetical protein